MAKRIDKDAPKNGYEAYHSGYASPPFDKGTPERETWFMQWQIAHAISFRSHCESREFSAEERLLEKIASGDIFLLSLASEAIKEYWKRNGGV